MLLNELSGRQKRLLDVHALSSATADSMSISEKNFDVAETFSKLFLKISKSIQDNILAPSNGSKIEEVDFSFFPTPVD